MTAATRLAVYGTLAPGRSNHHQLAPMVGHWSQGTVRGRLIDDDWATKGLYPLLRLDPDAPVINVKLFESADLPAHWARLDDFEGAAYQRVVTQVATPTGMIEAAIYVAAGPS